MTLLDKVKSADIRESLTIESLLLRLKRSQLRWYGYVTQMSQESTAKKLLCSTPIGRRPVGRPRTRWRDYIKDLSWSRLGIPAEHLSFVAEDRDAWRLQLELLPRDPSRISGSRKWKWMKKNVYLNISSLQKHFNDLTEFLNGIDKLSRNNLSNRNSN